MRVSDELIETVARAICNAHRMWPGRSNERQREIVDQAWRSRIPEAIIAIDTVLSAYNISRK